MKKTVLLVLTGIGFLAAPVWAEDAIRKEPIQFAKGATQATIQARIKGGKDVDYTIRAKAGQTMTVTLKTNNPMNYFNVLPPGADEALFVGQDGSGHFEGALPKDGEYIIRVYLMRPAARRNESAQYTLTVKVTGSATNDKTEATAPASVSFDEKLSLLGISFHVTSANAASGNTLRIAPAGLEIDNTPISREIDGVVTGAEVADINADGSPEIYVYTRASGAEARASLVAYSANKKKSLSAIYLPELTEHPNAAKGYQGHDDLAVVEGVFMRRFPIYGKGGDPAAPTGKTRQLQYKLKPGEAGWVLKLDRMIEY
ncbi:MAG: hypothetical protein WAV07_20265 [Candidatus Contendobacter sp.]